MDRIGMIRIRKASAARFWEGEWYVINTFKRAVSMKIAVKDR